jgi:DNA helicase II / ATP-dependent DNA helicase PcrA
VFSPDDLDDRDPPAGSAQRRGPDPDALLLDLDPEQREAVTMTSGPVAILAGAGSGKTRVISRRTAYAIATGIVPPDQVLVVTFTDKAAGEMVGRLRGLGLPGVTARTFHAHALSQLRFFWPLRHDGEPLPDLLDSKALIISRIARQLPGHYRFTPTKDLADEIEWAKSRRIAPREYEREAGTREPPIPADLFVRVYEGYERAKVRANRIDFDDLLLGTVALLETDEEAAATVRSRKRWFSVDEYQDTNPLQQRLLELWLGVGRDDLCVVGDEDQTIYTFTGASSAFLLGFEARWPGARVVELVRNYRSTPQVLDLANRLIAAEGRSKRLVPTRGDGPLPTISRHPSAEVELAALVTWIRARLGEGIAPAEVAVLVRMNAQLAPIEEALTRAGVAYQVRGLRFYDRPEVRSALAALRRPPLDAVGVALPAAVRARWAEAVGWEADGAAEGSREGGEARERQASLDTLLSIVDAIAAADPAADASTVVADLEARAAHERAGSADGVNLLTYHRAKGLEWDAVFLPSLEEGILPIRQAKDDEVQLAEERRLLYVGITRAREHLALSWAERRESRGRESRRQASRFLLDLRPPRGSRVTVLPPAPVEAARRPKAGESGDPVFEALRAWRTQQAREAAMPPYVIAHDATLLAIADARPRSLAALRRVKGMGEAKLEKYGDAILAVLAALEAAPGETP